MPPTATPHPPSAGQIALSATLHQLAATAAVGPLHLGDVLRLSQGRGYHVVLILLALPFLTPVPMLGLSTVFGTAIALIGAWLALGRDPRLPRRVLQHPLPARFAPALLQASSRLVRLLEGALKPRWQFLLRHAALQQGRGALILLSGLMLLLPVPVPFSNFFPAAAIVLLAASALEDDGAVLLLGVVACGVSAAFLGLIAVGGTAALQYLPGLLSP